ncbi:unnamed protein product [Periconia digitata]|uniref:C2H2-type domain-containing protein n=1 Tax=Periconia digitata TaxID=1303443 RepID=A0A9W4UI73_9PLEO|nr:unnamed protein product [Periconia digitata]
MACRRETMNRYQSSFGPPPPPSPGPWTPTSISSFDSRRDSVASSQASMSSLGSCMSDYSGPLTPISDERGSFFHQEHRFEQVLHVQPVTPKITTSWDAIHLTNPSAFTPTPLVQYQFDTHEDVYPLTDMDANIISLDNPLWGSADLTPSWNENPQTIWDPNMPPAINLDDRCMSDEALHGFTDTNVSSTPLVTQAFCDNSGFPPSPQEVMRKGEQPLEFKRESDPEEEGEPYYVGPTGGKTPKKGRTIPDTAKKQPKTRVRRRADARRSVPAIIPKSIYSCTWQGGCGKSYQRREHRKRHVETVHLKKDMFRCVIDKCKDKGPFRMDNYKAHWLTHVTPGNCARNTQLSRDAVVQILRGNSEVSKHADKIIASIDKKLGEEATGRTTRAIR